jgi:tetratricopeptide (TPR) repeat protein
MAICYFDLEEYEAALEAAGKAVELIPQHYNMMCMQGVILLSKGQHDMAAQMLGKCLSLEPWSNAANYLSQALDLMNNK